MLFNNTFLLLQNILLHSQPQSVRYAMQQFVIANIFKSSLALLRFRNKNIFKNDDNLVAQGKSIIRSKYFKKDGFLNKSY